MTLSLPEQLSPPIQWKFSQVFGDRCRHEDVLDDDIVSAIQFDKTGIYLAVGDHGGRVMIFESIDGKNDQRPNHSRHRLEQSDFTDQHAEYRYKTEFQSHEPGFDYLRSWEIKEKINKVRWYGAQNGCLSILSTNDKTIKFWKVKDHKMKKVEEFDLRPFVSSENTLLAEKSFMNGQDGLSLSNGCYLEWTEKVVKHSKENCTGFDNTDDSANARCRKMYAHTHDFSVNSISNNSDGETFLSADDLRINLWNIEITNQCFNVIDMKPPNMDDLLEVITSAEFHPIQCNLLAYSSSRGFIRLVDLRQSAICDNTARIYKNADHGPTSIFREIVASISDIKLANDGRYILSRDYMSLKLWDMHMESSPVAIFNNHDHLRSKLSELYNNDSIFDKFDCCISGRGLHFATGSYSNVVRIFSHGRDTEGSALEASRTPNRKQVLQAAPRTRRSSFSNLERRLYRQGHENSASGNNELQCDFSSAVKHLAWHPTENLIACASKNSLLLYYA